jgi:Uma2 family endonuclease
MINHGILTEDDDVELLRGVICKRSRRGPMHVTSVTLTANALDDVLLAGWHRRTHCPLTTLDSEPEADVAIIANDPLDYRGHHPVPAEIAILIEVADITLDHDRNIKRSIYASAGIPIYWIINLVDRQIEVYSDPTGPAADPTYRTIQIFTALQSVPLVIAGQTIAHIPAAEMLP